ncbi:hypothetical protein SJI00_13440 [Pseudomonas sp. RP23018S]|uniref:hypothetical protein n=1 Tax=Pseudomonas sp. RP23018S TaxID=3096037 RepID=UPI002ACA0214|nr:hypothetical protein [Pseudomonas sp. RP23018S]MDZ5603781.1 hypothetical protein [Pseudomonas sp. RP23018S]
MMSTDPRDAGFIPQDDPATPDPSRDPLSPGMPDPGRPEVPGDDPIVNDPDKSGWDQQPDRKPGDGLPLGNDLPLTDALNPPRA